VVLDDVTIHTIASLHTAFPTLEAGARTSWLRHAEHFHELLSHHAHALSQKSTSSSSLALRSIEGGGKLTSLVNGRDVAR
jgi:hypothetical protein